ncbi:MAG: hypothetical protein MUD01_16500 [Chloroflexaceae bacterium]|jgi:hypothetical protein|nr:hypothetical protein [Chloroflexaceae bacterium]
MAPKSVWFYEAKVAFGFSALLPAALLPLYGVYLWLLTWRTGKTPTSAAIGGDLELILPLVAALTVAHLMTVEREERFALLRASYPEHPLRLPLLRTLGGLGLALLWFGLAVACAWSGVGAVDPLALLAPACAPALVLLGAALATGNLTGSYWAAAGLVLVWWLGEVISRGTFSQWLFLFAHRWPPDGVDYTSNRWLLAAFGVALLLLNGGICMWRQAMRHYGD